MGRFIEKFYPMIISVFVMIISGKYNINYIDSKNLPDALNADITIASIVIGFLGAILPVILGMKNNSKFVHYVFELDKDKLFLKYIKETILSGILSIIISMILFFNDKFTGSIIYQYAFYIWVGCMVYMLLCTYRSVSCMIELMFKEDIKVSGYLSSNNGDNDSQENVQREERLNKNIPKIDICEIDE